MREVRAHTVRDLEAMLQDVRAEERARRRKAAHKKARAGG